MLCQNCKQRESTIHVTKIINGQATQLHLCQECAQKVQGFGFGFSIYPGMVSDFLQALFGMNPAGRLSRLTNCNKKSAPVANGLSRRYNKP
jgi:protein arginine kinase activator